MIDTYLPGDPDSIEDMADWLLRTLRVEVDDAGDAVVHARRMSSRTWGGESGDAYRGFTRQVVLASDEASSDILTAEDAFRRCGSQLRRAQETLIDCLRQAHGGGLAVVAFSILPPETAVDPGPAPRDVPLRATEHWAEQQAAFNEQQRKAALYHRLQREATAALREYDEWCNANLTPPTTRGGESSSLVDALLSKLESAAPDVLNFQFSYAARKLSVQVEHLQNEAKAERARAKQITVDRRSGDSSRRGPASKASPSDARRQAWLLERVGDEYAKSPIRHLPLLGNIISLGVSAKEISDGESPGRVISGDAGGSLAGAGIVAVAVSVNAPVALVVLSGIGAGYFGAQGGKGLWDALPEGVREDIDAGLKKAWEKRKDFGGGIVDGTVGGLKSLAGGTG